MNKFNFNPQEDFKDTSSKPNHSKYEYDLYDENIAAQKDDVIRVKRVSLPNGGNNWKITKNNKLVFLLEGIKLSKKEKDFLLTEQGFKFLIAQSKDGIKSFNHLKAELKKNLPTK